MAEKWVKKSDGSQAPFEPEKLGKSLFRSGASESLIKEIVELVMNNTEPITTTKKIYNKAYAALRRSSTKLAGKYRLKNAVLQLGPSGYPFEHFVGHLLAYQGFERKVGTMMQGKCLSHEVDILAKKNQQGLIVECKHHSQPGYKSDVKVVMYVHSRFTDIVNGVKEKHPLNYQCVIATNTRFTADAITYANCYQILLISWDYPNRGSLKERIEISGLYPITCLNSLTKNEKQRLLKEEIVLCKELLVQPNRLQLIDQRKHRKILEECQELLTED